MSTLSSTSDLLSFSESGVEVPCTETNGKLFQLLMSYVRQLAYELREVSLLWLTASKDA